MLGAEERRLRRLTNTLQGDATDGNPAKRGTDDTLMVDQGGSIELAQNAKRLYHPILEIQPALSLLRSEMKYKIVLKKTDEGYSASCPGLPGCWSQGDTELEAIENMKDAIQEYLAAISDSISNADVREIDIAV